jgi:hypothetical protein
MTNTQAAFGFRHIGFLSGGAPDYQQQSRLIQSTDTTKIFAGDPVVKSGAYVVRASNNTTTLEGIFVGCMYTPSGGLGIPQWSPYWPGAASADATAYLINAPNALFLAAALLTAINVTTIGFNIGFAIGTGSTVGGGLSGATLDQSTLGTTSTLPFQVVSLYQGIGNGSDTTTSYNWAVVAFNNQRFKSTTGVA